MLSIAKSGSFSTVETASKSDGGGYLGITSRPAMLSKQMLSQQHKDEKRTMQQQSSSSKFVSPGNSISMCSKYSI